MTIKEVAKLAGVSPASVSRYLNDGPVSDSMRFKIRRVIEETGFQPNQYAQTMRSGRSRQILVIIPRLDSMSASQILNGVSERLIQSDYMLILGLTGGDHDKEAQYLKNLQSSMVDGIILMGTGMTKELRNCILAADRPVVVTGQNFSGIPCVYHDDYHAVKDLTGRALAGGRRHLAYLGVRREDLAAGEQRQMGAYDAIIEAGFDPNRCDWGTVEFSFESGELVMKQMLERSPEIDAVICATDTIALGAMKALRANG